MQALEACDGSCDYLAGDGEALFLPRWALDGDGPLLFNLSADCLQCQQCKII